MEANCPRRGNDSTKTRSDVNNARTPQEKAVTTVVDCSTMIVGRAGRLETAPSSGGLARAIAAISARRRRGLVGVSSQISSVARDHDR